MIERNMKQNWQNYSFSGLLFAYHWWLVIQALYVYAHLPLGFHCSEHHTTYCPVKTCPCAATFNSRMTSFQLSKQRSVASTLFSIDSHLSPRVDKFARKRTMGSPSLFHPVLNYSSGETPATRRQLWRNQTVKKVWHMNKWKRILISHAKSFQCTLMKWRVASSS